MAAEGVADGTESGGAFHKRERLEDIEGAGVIPDGLHGAARVAEGWEVGRVAGEVRIGGRDGDVAARGEFAGVLAIGFSAESDDDAGTGGLIGGVETEDGGKWAGGGGRGGVAGKCSFGDAEKGGSAAAGFGLVGNPAEHISAAVDFLFDAYIDGDAFD